MHYSEVWNIAAGLPKGKAYVFSDSDINKAAECMLESSFDYVRRCDVVKFTENLENEFGVDMHENPTNGQWTMRRL